jgi:hypothetical protein
MRSTFQNSGMSLSIGIFFSLLIAGLANTLPKALTSGLTAQGVPLATAASIAHLPPVSTVFAAMLGYNPVQNLLAPTGLLHTLPAANVATLTGKTFFPNLISAPFHHGLTIVFTAAALMSLAGAAVSWMRGKKTTEAAEPPAAVTTDSVTTGVIPTDEPVRRPGHLPARPRRHGEAADHGGDRRPVSERRRRPRRRRRVLRRLVRLRQLTFRCRFAAYAAVSRRRPWPRWRGPTEWY